MERRVVISTIQLPWRKSSSELERIKAENLGLIFESLEEAGKRGSDVTVFGEIANFVHIPWTKENFNRYLDTVPGPITERLGNIAQRYSMNIIAPLFAITGGKIRNTAVIIDRSGEVVGQYFKVHLPLEEAKWAVPGEEILTFDMDFGRIGIMICMDIEYPEQALVLMIKGAELIFFPHLQSSWGEVDWEIRYRSRAIDTGLYLVSSSYGIEKGDSWKPGMLLGRSGIVAPDGIILAEASRYAGIVTREIDLEQKRLSNFHFADGDYNRTLAILSSRRPELYGELVNPASKERALRSIRETPKNSGCGDKQNYW